MFTTNNVAKSRIITRVI